MKKLKSYIYPFIPVAIIILFASCAGPGGSVDSPPPTVYDPPVVQHLKLSAPVKINLDSMKTTRVYPVVKPFQLKRLPAQSYDTTGFKRFKHPFEKTALPYNNLPEKDFDLDKLSSVPVKFKTSRLPQPQVIKTGSPHLKIANELAIYEFGDAGGLNKSMITALFTDQIGYLWIASGKGLYRYDGDNLSLVLPVLNRNYINSILEDSNHKIWLTTAGDGLKMLDLAAGILKVAGGGQGLGGDNYYSIVQDYQKRLWLSGERLGGVVVVDLVTSTAKMLNQKNGLSSSLVNRVMAKNGHQIWVATGAGINIIDLATKKIKFLNKAAGLKSDTVDALLNDSRGRTWIATHGGHLQFLNTQKDTSYYLGDVSASAQPIIKLFEDARRGIWVLTSGGGVETIDVDQLKVRYIKKNNGLANDFSISASQDSKGQVWIGTFTGLNMFGQNSLIKRHLGTAEVMSSIEDKQGMIWLASDKGVDIIDTVSQTSRSLTRQQGLDIDFLQGLFTIEGKVIVAGGNGFDIIDKEKHTISHCSRKQGFINQVAIAIMTDKHGVWWIGGDKGIDVFDPVKNTVRHIGKALGLSNYDAVISLAVDKLGRVWAGSTNGRIFVIDPASGTLSRLPLLDKFRNDAFSPVILMTDSKGRIWVGLSTGVLIADVADQTLSSFSAPQGLIGTPVRSLLQRGAKVYAAAYEGITVIAPPDNEYAKQRKWEVSKFGSSYGINKATSSDLLMTDQINHNGLYLLGRLGVTVLDLNRKDTSTSRACITAINIADQRQYFLSDSGYMENNGIRWDGIDSAFNIPLKLRVPYDQNSFQFEYGVNDLSRIDTAWYRCKLAGVDEQWGPVSNEPKSKYYSNLKPGSYTFYVVTRNKNGSWSEPARFDFTINPPWWQTWWAYLLFLTFFAGIVWGYAHIRSIRLIKEKRVLETKIEERTEEVRRQKEKIEAQRDSLEKSLKELKATQTQLIQSEKMASLGELTAGIAHEIQNPLNFVNNFSEVSVELLDELKEEAEAGNKADVLAIADDLTQNLQKIHHHGKRADFIVKGMLQHSRTSSGDRQLTDINVLANEFLKLSYHGLRAKDKNFNAELFTDFAENLPKLNVVQQDIGRVLLNLFNNAFYAVNEKKKTAGADYKPEVTVSTSVQGDCLTIKVKDNGQGIPDAIKDKIMQPFFTTKPTGAGTGLGLSLSYDIVVNGLGGRIEAISEENKFAEFTVILPLL